MVINKALRTELIDFLSHVPAKRLKRNSIKMLLSFLQHELKTGYPIFVDELLADLVLFFDLLDVIDQEVDQSGLI